MNISIYYQNCRGLDTKRNEFYENVLQQNYDMIAATDTWLSCEVGDSELVDPDLYNIVNCERYYEALNEC